MSDIFKNSSTSFSRCVGLLLVLFIFYGTTVEAAHRHGRVLPSTTSHNASVADPGAGNSTSTTKPGCSDCLICQLHQNFSATLISAKPNAEPLGRLTYSLSFVPLVISSTNASPQSGRAPPQSL
jgi:hypothetical protein